MLNEGQGQGSKVLEYMSRSLYYLLPSVGRRMMEERLDGGVEEAAGWWLLPNGKGDHGDTDAGDDDEADSNPGDIWVLNLWDLLLEVW